MDRTSVFVPLAIGKARRSTAWLRSAASGNPSSPKPRMGKVAFAIARSEPAELRKRSSASHDPCLAIAFRAQSDSALGSCGVVASRRAIVRAAGML